MFSLRLSNDGNDLLLGGGSSLDHVYGGKGNDLGAGDCVYVAFDNDAHIVASINTISEQNGKPDELSMGLGNDIAIGGAGDDIIYGEDGMDILIGDNGAVAFHDSSESHVHDQLWSAPRTISSTGETSWCCHNAVTPLISC